MVSDDHIREACELLDRVREIQYQRVHPNDGPENWGPDWHPPDVVLNALSVLDSYRTQAALQYQAELIKQVAGAQEQRWREMMGKKLDG